MHKKDKAMCNKTQIKGDVIFPKKPVPQPMPKPVRPQPMPKRPEPQPLKPNPNPNEPGKKILTD